MPWDGRETCSAQHISDKLQWSYANFVVTGGTIGIMTTLTCAPSDEKMVSWQLTPSYVASDDKIVIMTTLILLCPLVTTNSILSQLIPRIR